LQHARRRVRPAPRPACGAAGGPGRRRAVAGRRQDPAAGITRHAPDRACACGDGAGSRARAPRGGSTRILRRTRARGDRDGPHPPRAMGRHRVPTPPGRPRDPSLREDRGDRGLLRRDDHAPALGRRPLAPPGPAGDLLAWGCRVPGRAGGAVHFLPGRVPDRIPGRAEQRAGRGGHDAEPLAPAQAAGDAADRLLQAPARELRAGRPDGPARGPAPVRAAQRGLRAASRGARARSGGALPVNRTGVVEALDGMLAEAGADSVTAVVLVRIQRVRELLQVYGYGSGDSIGEAACKRLSGLLRPSDRLYRVGKFEFVALLPRLHDKNHGALAGHRVVRAFQSPIEVDGAEVMASMVAAVAVARGDGNTATSLLRRAEHAYTRALRRPERMALNRDGEEPRLIPYAVLRDAIAANRLAAWMQPILDLRTRQVMGAESLSRWNHPQHGPVPPDVFIPLAERTGLISELTWWSINASLRQLAEARVL